MRTHTRDVDDVNIFRIVSMISVHLKLSKRLQVELSILEMSDTVNGCMTPLRVSIAIIIAFDIVYCLIVAFYWYIIRESHQSYHDAWWNAPWNEKHKRFEELGQKSLTDFISYVIIIITFFICHTLLSYFLVNVS